VFERDFVQRLNALVPQRDLALLARRNIDWSAKGFESRSLDDLATAHEIENSAPHRAIGDVATLLTLLSYRPRRRKPYLYELLRKLPPYATRVACTRKPDGSGPKG